MGLPAVGTPCRVLGLGKLREGFIPDFPDIPEGGDRLLFGFAVFHGIEVECVRSPQGEDPRGPRPAPSKTL